MEHERHGERAFCPLAPFEIAGVFRRVVAEIASSRGGDIPGHPVVFRAGEEDPGLRLRLHALGKERFEPAGLAIEEADFDHVKQQKIPRIMETVALEEVDIAPFHFLCNCLHVDLYPTKIKMASL